MQSFQANVDRERYASPEKLSPTSVPVLRDDRRRRENGITSNSILPAMMKKVMQAFPAYPNSSLIGGNHSGSNSEALGVGITGRDSNKNGKINFGKGSILEGMLSPGSRVRYDDFLGGSPGRKSASERYEKQFWNGRSATANIPGKENEYFPRNGKTSQEFLHLQLPPVLQLPQQQHTFDFGHGNGRSKRSQRNERVIRKTSRDDMVLGSRGLEDFLPPVPIAEHFVVDKPASRKARLLNAKMTINDPNKISKVKSERRPQTIGADLRIPAQESLESNYGTSLFEDTGGDDNQVTKNCQERNSQTCISREKNDVTSTPSRENTAGFNNKSPTSSDTKIRQSSTKLKASGVSQQQGKSGHNLQNLATKLSCEEGCDSAAKTPCSKCHNLSRKVKTQAQTTRNLQRQNGCLESIITQKRNLVEQLTRQIRVLMKENFMLLGKEGDPEDVPIPSDSTSVPALSQSKAAKSDLGSSSSTPSLTKTIISEERSGIPEKILPVTVHRSKSKTSVTVSTKRRPSVVMQNGGLIGRKYANGGARNPDVLEEYDKQIQTLQNANETLQARLDKARKENLEATRFLSDLLYTLNARGYESITDFEGSIVDLYRCRGDHLLELKGRDARARTPVKRMTPQETLLKAVIGSQEKLIQSLFVQLETRTREALLGSRLNSDNASYGNGSDGGTRNAALESEILALVCLIEGACQRNPDIYHVLQDQAIVDRESKHSSGLNANNIVIEAVLDRCQRMLCTGSPPSSPRLRTRGREFSNPRSGTPPYPTRTSSAGGGSHAMNRSDRNSSEESHRYQMSTSPQIDPSQDQPKFYPSEVRPPSQSSHRTLTANSNNGGRQPSPRLDDSPKRKASLPRCRFCGMKFPPNISLAEINSHLEMHNV